MVNRFTYHLVESHCRDGNASSLGQPVSTSAWALLRVICAAPERMTLQLHRMAWGYAKTV